MKSQISAVGGNNWYIFLGLLHWMMQLAKMMEQYSTGIYDDASQDAGYDVHGDRIMWDFLADAYRAWGQAEDEDDYMYAPDPSDDDRPGGRRRRWPRMRSPRRRPRTSA